MNKFAATLLAAMALGAGPVPASAQQLNFGIFFGDERSDFYPERITCLTEHQVRQAVADRGYTDIYLNVEMDKHIQVRANRGGWTYLLDFDMCTGRIEGRQRLRPAG
jgi:hypothetical protein